MASAPREVWGDLATTAFVQASHLFKSLDDDARGDLLRLARTVAYEPGEVISAEGDDGFYLFVDGAAEVLVSAPGGGAASLAHLERGAFYGEGRVLGAARPASLVAASGATAVVFPAAVIAAIGERFPKVRKLLEAVHGAREKDAAAKLAG